MSEQRKIFIDCGSYTGDTISLFMKTPSYSKDYVIYSLEAARSRIDIQKKTFKDLNIQYLAAVVWIYDGEITFKQSTRRKGLADALFKNRLASSEKDVILPCIDFSQWMLKNFVTNDYIVLKMDIEGAEVEVLRKMIDDASIKLVKILYLETHGRRRMNKRGEIASLLSELKKIEGLDLRGAIEKHKF